MPILAIGPQIDRGHGNPEQIQVSLKELILYQSDNPQPILPQYRPIHLAFPFFYKEQELYWDPPLVSTEDDFTGQTVSHQAWNNAPIHQFITISPVRCLSAISSANPSIINQSTTNIIPIPVNTSGKCVNIQGTRTLLWPTIGLVNRMPIPVTILTG